MLSGAAEAAAAAAARAANRIAQLESALGAARHRADELEAAAVSSDDVEVLKTKAMQLVSARSLLLRLRMLNE